ncbi:hypothetical protein DEH18_01055 [Streptomyces sp. NHF165]|nr:hypothetical protein DEH18_01055 [Streptomyces sp. NHF165]
MTQRSEPPTTRTFPGLPGGEPGPAPAAGVRATARAGRGALSSAPARRLPPAYDGLPGGQGHSHE